MARKTYRTKGAAKRAKRKGGSVYKTKKGWRVSAGKKRRKRRCRR